MRTDEETFTLLGRWATHYPDAVIADILNRQGRRTVTGMRFTANRAWQFADFLAKPSLRAECAVAAG